MKIILSVFTAIIFTGPYSAAQIEDERKGVVNAVRNYVDAFYYGDTTMIQKSVSPLVTKVGYFIPKGKATYESESMSFRQMMDYAARVNRRGPNPRVGEYIKVIDVFDVLDQTASAKLTAWWGTDYLLLAKKQGNWMITHVIWQSPPPKK